MRSLSTANPGLEGEADLGEGGQGEEEIEVYGNLEGLLPPPPPVRLWEDDGAGGQGRPLSAARRRDAEEDAAAAAAAAKAAAVAALVAARVAMVAGDLHRCVYLLPSDVFSVFY